METTSVQVGIYHFAGRYLCLADYLAATYTCARFYYPFDPWSSHLARNVNVFKRLEYTDRYQCF